MIQEKDAAFISALGFTDAKIHSRWEHFDFQAEGRIFMVIGPMGSGKTQFAAQVWRDAQVIRQKSKKTLEKTQTSEGAQRTDLFFVRSRLDSQRFQGNPSDALSYRGGYECLGDSIAYAHNSYEIESLINDNPKKGLWIIDEPAFYDERLAYLIQKKAKERHLTFLLTGIVLDFRKNIFNETTRLLLEFSTDIIPLTAYCEHLDCLEKTFLTYRFYQVGKKEIPALFFDPLILVGGDVLKDSSSEPNYASRCRRHHFLIGKEYTYCILIPLARLIAREDGREALKKELRLLKTEIKASEFYTYVVLEMESKKLEKNGLDLDNILEMPYIAEKALHFLLQEEALLSQDFFISLIQELNLDQAYLKQILRDINLKELN